MADLGEMPTYSSMKPEEVTSFLEENLSEKVVTMLAELEEKHGLQARWLAARIAQQSAYDMIGDKDLDVIAHHNLILRQDARQRGIDQGWVRRSKG